MYRVLVVDDEDLGRRAVCRLLESDPRFEVVGQAADGPTALATIRELEPDVAFLDLAMPGLGGIDIASRCPDPKPVLVFVTAHDRHAVEAFREAALDYVLKPIDPARFAVTLDRVAERLELEASHQRGHSERLTVRSGARTVIIDVADLVYVEARGNYLELHATGSTERVRMTLANLLAQLQGTPVVRVHRSFAVHIDRIRALEGTDGSHAARLVLKDGAAIPVGRTYRDQLKRLLDTH